MAGNLLQFPKYSTGANPASNHQDRLVGVREPIANLTRAHPLVPGDELPECRRLVVLIPAGEIQETLLVQQIWRLASPHSLPILMLGIARDYETETALLRRQAELAAFTRDRFVKVETRIMHSSSWVKALQAVIQPGDVILCNAEQEVGKGLFQVQPLCEVLSRSLRLPVYVVSGYYTQKPPLISKPFRQVLAWIVLPLVLAGFIGLDTRVVEEISGPWQQVLLFFLLAIEIGTIWVWNTWVG